MMDPDSKLVYSTDPERNKKCPRCKNLLEECSCKQPEEWLPSNIKLLMRLETAGRSGKTVTVITGFPDNEQELRQLTKLLKNRCGSGGTYRKDPETGEAQIEIQGDKRDLIKGLMLKIGFKL
jgi:translation initiation factor 1